MHLMNTCKADQFENIQHITVQNLGFNISVN